MIFFINKIIYSILKNKFETFIYILKYIMNYENVLKEIMLKIGSKKKLIDKNKYSINDFSNNRKKNFISLSYDKLEKNINRKKTITSSQMKSFEGKLKRLNSFNNIQNCKIKNIKMLQIKNKFSLNRFINKPNQNIIKDKKSLQNSFTETQYLTKKKSYSMDKKRKIELEPFDFTFKIGKNNSIDRKHFINNIRKKYDSLNLKINSLLQKDYNLKVKKIKEQNIKNTNNTSLLNNQNTINSTIEKFEYNITNLSNKNKLNVLSKKYSITIGDREKLFLRSFNNQICSDIKKPLIYYENSTFIDCYFPPSNISICPIDLIKEIKVPYDKIYWLRIHQIFKDKKISLYDNEYDKMFCINQGWIKNSNLISSLIMISKINFNIIKKLIIDIKINENGQYRILINNKGIPTLVIIDDYFPCLKGTRFPLFVKSPHNNIWPMIIEKVFAKIYGSYYNLQKISTQEILEMLLFYKVETIFIKLNYDYLWNVILTINKNEIRGIIGTINEDKNDENEIGLLNNSSYYIDSVFEEIIDGKYYRLLKLKYPIIKNTQILNSTSYKKNLINNIPINSCNNYKFKGKFSSNSYEWNDQLIKKIKYDKNRDEILGFFYISFDDFIDNFSSITIVDLIRPLFTCFIYLEKENTLNFIFLERESEIFISCYDNDTFLMKLNSNYSIEIIDINNKWINNIYLKPGIYIIYCITQNIGSYLIFGSKSFFIYKIEYPNQIISELLRIYICNNIIYNDNKIITKFVKDYHFNYEHNIGIYHGFFHSSNLGFIYIENNNDDNYIINTNIKLENCIYLENNDYSTIYIKRNQILGIFLYKINNMKNNIYIDFINKKINRNSNYFLPNFDILIKFLKSIQKPNSSIFNHILK